MVCPNCGAENIADARFCRNCGAALTSEMLSPLGESAVAPPHYMGFWIRLLAYLIDSVVLTLAIVVLYGIAIAVAAALGDTAGGVMALLAWLASLVGTWFYYAYMVSSEKQATLGKMALGMRITDLAGGRLTFGKATGRFFAWILSGLLLYIGYIMIAFDDRKQGLHDKLAGTLVVKNR